MLSGVENWLRQIDDRGAGALFPPHCRENLFKAEALLAPCKPQPLHFAEFSLLGDPCFDMTWSVYLGAMLEARGIPTELCGAQRLAADLAPDGILMFEYDTSEPKLPPAGFYFKGMLADGSHAAGRMMECVGRAEEKRAALLVVAKLAKLGYESRMCGVMVGRDGSPARITAKPIGEFSAVRLMSDLLILGFDCPPFKYLNQLNSVCTPNEHMFSAPVIYLDMMPDGALGPTLGVELNGLKMSNVGDYPQILLAQEWGLADNRWEVLRDASFSGKDNFFFAPNTLKFRWRDGEPLPAKLYMKAGWS